MEKKLENALQPPRFVDGRPMLIAGLGQRFEYDNMDGIPALWQRLRPHIGNMPNEVEGVAYGVVTSSDAEGFDRRTLVEAVRIARRIFRAKAFDAYRGAELFPGDGDDSSAAIEAFLRRKCETVYHPVGTCRMGSDELAVVDAKLRVRGVEALRVVDASIMPKIVSGNTNAPTVAIAEKASRMILAAA